MALAAPTESFAGWDPDAVFGNRKSSSVVDESIDADSLAPVACLDTSIDLSKVLESAKEHEESTSARHEAIMNASRSPEDVNMDSIAPEATSEAQNASAPIAPVAELPAEVQPSNLVLEQPWKTKYPTGEKVVDQQDHKSPVSAAN